MAFDINTRFDGLPHLETPYEFLVNYDEELLDGSFSPYKWQREILQSFGRDIKPESENPKDQLIRELLVANNGSGKSQFILAPCCVWLATQFPDTLCCVTSSSHKQMNDQTERYIRHLCERVNEVNKDRYPEGFWTITKGSIRSKHNNSKIDLFVTDEAGKFEGRHPIRPGRRFGFFFDECKSIADELFGASYRCNGMSHRLEQSSPGDMIGDFYKHATDEHPDSPWNRYTVTIYDCPHINLVEANEMIRSEGPDDPLVRSSLFAEFTSFGQNVVIPREIFNKNQKFWSDPNYRKNTKNFFGERRAGLDLAAGGDENVLSVWHGNVQLGLEAFRMKDTSLAVDEIIERIKKYPGLKPENIFADDGGVGRGILDQLRRKGYNLKRVLNQHTARDKTRYFNRGTELWMNFKRFVEEGFVCFLKDDQQTSQLCARYYFRKDNDKILLEAKAKARAAGHPSPDRADACVLAWSRLRYPLEFMTEKEPEPEQGVSAAQFLAMHKRARFAKLKKKLNEGEEEQGFKGYRQHKYVEELINE